MRIALSGPKQVTAGQPAVFSMRVTNTSDRTLDLVDVYVNALREPDLGEEIDEDTDFEEWVLPVEWSSADAPRGRPSGRSSRPSSSASSPRTPTTT